MLYNNYTQIKKYIKKYRLFFTVLIVQAGIAISMKLSSNEDSVTKAPYSLWYSHSLRASVLLSSRQREGKKADYLWRGHTPLQALVEIWHPHFCLDSMDQDSINMPRSTTVGARKCPITLCPRLEDRFLMKSFRLWP